ncbi:SGNH/GDSL hydrolase family protein [Microbacterium ulmi]|uniref:SGNH/GDSL hydrolase family protein n=1 Tax=Microbacterium ulmi TaxID=179095 RepID=A0A7Y2PZH8_9MICO|nr:SGNH/GDSL hydrolase family protein [Microbacterium ulmi]NII68215.1 lysophospholipase L1-like esterase [Microbacterium ulmi]NNH02307.1 SGNH/GDSL hydrolase family protein [Microbacterium ulmi]
MRSTRAAIAALSVASVASAVLGAGVVLRRQAAQARRRIGKPLGETALDADRVWRPRHEGPPVELLLLGDSIAAGLGAQRPKETLGARLAKGVGRNLHRPVRLRTAAIVGSESSALAAQLDALPDQYRADVAVIVVGGNDVTHRVPVATSVGHLELAVRRLREHGTAVVVGTCPDLGALRPVPQPLRALGSRLSRQLAAAQAQSAERAGAAVVSTARAVGPFFISQPDEMFSLDRFHPSALGYRRTAEALLPAVLGALAPVGPATAGKPPHASKRAPRTEPAAVPAATPGGSHEPRTIRG